MKWNADWITAFDRSSKYALRCKAERCRAFTEFLIKRCEMLDNELIADVTPTDGWIEIKRPEINPRCPKCPGFVYIAKITVSTKHDWSLIRCKNPKCSYQKTYHWKVDEMAFWTEDQYQEYQKQIWTRYMESVESKFGGSDHLSKAKD